MIALRVDYRHRNAGEQTERDEALLTVGEPVVFERIRCTLEHARRVQEVKPVRFEI
jgi:hypothetical protein